MLSTRARAITLANLFALSVLLWSSLAFAIIEITEPVTDPERYLTQSDRDALSDALVLHRTSTRVQIAVVFVRTTEGQSIEDFTHTIAVRWGGGVRGQDNGAVVLFAIQDRRSRIELGSGLESRVSDASARTMLDDARPYLREQRYGAAAVLVTSALIRMTGGIPAGLTTPTPARREVPNVVTPNWNDGTDTSSGESFIIFVQIFLLTAVLFSPFLLLLFFWSKSSGTSVSSNGHYESGSSIDNSPPSYSSFTSSSFSGGSSTSYSGGGGTFGGGGASSSW